MLPIGVANTCRIFQYHAHSSKLSYVTSQ
jgi:hypothetical protein